MKKLQAVIGQRIRSYRKRFGFTQVAFSEESGIEYRHLQKLEAGEVDIKASTVSRLAECFNVPACFLLEQKTSIATSNDLGIPCPVTVLERLPIAAQVMDNTGLVQYCNEALTLLTGLKKEEIVGKMYGHDFIGDPGRREHCRELLNGILRDRPAPVPYVTTSITKSGRPIPVILTWNYLYGARNEVVGIVSVATPTPEAGQQFPQI